MTRPDPWPPDRRALFATLWLAGRSSDDIADALGIAVASVKSVAWRLRRSGAELPRRAPGLPRVPVERVEAAARLVEAGASPDDVARALRVRPSSVRSTLTRLRKRGHAIPRRVK